MAVAIVAIGIAAVELPHYFARVALREKLRKCFTGLEDNQSREIDLHSVTDFPWDTVYVFGPYSSKRDVVKIIGVPWNGSTDVADDEGTHLLIFMQDGKVVRYTDLGRGTTDFAVNAENFIKCDGRFLEKRTNGRKVSTAIVTP